MKLVTAIIVNYNKSLYIRDAIDSVLSQKYQNMEVIIIDDGSTDNSNEVIDLYQNIEGIRIIYQENHGVIYTRNKAINEAKGELIVQLDGDDLLLDGFIKTAVNQFDKKISRIVYGSTFRFGEKNGLWNLGKYTLEKQLVTNQIVISAMFSKKDFLKVGGYDKYFELGYEDWDFWLNLISSGVEVVQLDVPMLKYRILKKSRNKFATENNIKKIRERIYWKYVSMYKENMQDALNLTWELLSYKEIEKSAQQLLNSRAYKLGKLILLPFRLIKNNLKIKSS
tara:strand:- start:8606 stop:9448 length:843 start_codon:yes stop_codon:yes gene_type:complete